jgi:DNA-binding MarR family transcriptional regulator
MAHPAFDAIAEARRLWARHELDEPLAMAAATSIMRANQLVTIAVDRALRPIGLTFARYEVLMLLRFARSGALPVTKMGERLMVHPTGMTKLVDKLEHDDLVRREPNPEDRRGTLVRLTPAGQRLTDTATKAVGAVRFGADLPDDDLEGLVELLRRLRIEAGDLAADEAGSPAGPATGPPAGLPVGSVPPERAAGPPAVPGAGTP